jgi:F-type H+-transporting ATPase subunit b
MTVLALAENVLSIDGSFLFVFISIFILIFVLNRTLFKPINQVLEERERLGLGRLKEARHLLVEYEQRLKSYEEQLRSARSEAYQFLEVQRREAQASRQRMIAEVKAETAEQINDVKQDLAKQAEKAKQSLENEARAMAAVISSQILHRPVSIGGD